MASSNNKNSSKNVSHHHKNYIYRVVNAHKGLSLSIVYKLGSDIGIQSKFSTSLLTHSIEHSINQGLKTLSVPVDKDYMFYRSGLMEFLQTKENYRARRHIQLLPLNGQRTRSNARTQKNKRGGSSASTLRTAFKRKGSRKISRKEGGLFQSFQNYRLNIIEASKKRSTRRTI